MIGRADRRRIRTRGSRRRGGRDRTTAPQRLRWPSRTSRPDLSVARAHVTVHPTRPALRALEEFTNRSRGLDLSYEPVGLAQQSPAGWNVDSVSAVIGRGEEDFARAKRALASWQHFAIAWMEMYPRDAPQIPGTIVTIAARVCGIWWLNGCRVLYRLDAVDGRSAGFAYGTLTNHVEAGEEQFIVAIEPNGAVHYSIRAVSRPRSMVVRFGYPYTRLLQARFRRASIAAMRHDHQHLHDRPARS